MGDTGSPYNLPFPELTDTPDVPQDIEDLATAVHADLDTIDDKITVLRSAVTAKVTSSASVGGTEVTVVTAPSITGDGTQKWKITVSWGGFIDISADSSFRVTIKESAAYLMAGDFHTRLASSGTERGGAGSLSCVVTPSAASHTYAMIAQRRAGGAGSSIYAHAEVPATIMVEPF